LLRWKESAVASTWQSRCKCLQQGNGSVCSLPKHQRQKSPPQRSKHGGKGTVCACATNTRSIPSALARRIVVPTPRSCTSPATPDAPDPR
ncbi:hypothetical protein BaRGS_00023188, partial [Batillaria attramentaria]